MFVLGLDLGQRRDHSAIVLVERAQAHAYLTAPEKTLQVRMAERLPLGLSYPEMVEMVRHVVGMANQRAGLGYGGRPPQCRLAVDATGLGKPVVEMLRAARLGCELTAVTITSGDKENRRAGESGAMNVPKQDLISELQVVLDHGELRIAAGLKEAGTLKRELLDVRMTRRESGYVRFGADGSGQHDDLVIALALAVWRARRW